MPLVLSHNDLSTANLLVRPNHEIIFIDYEWSRLNNEYWDAANFIREACLSQKQIQFLLSCNPKWKSEILNDMIYICTNYAYQWTFNMPNNSKMIRCRKLNLNKMNKYYKLFFVTNCR
jgi:thiamine kinase-like enzyme